MDDTQFFNMDFWIHIIDMINNERISTKLWPIVQRPYIGLYIIFVGCISGGFHPLRISEMNNNNRKAICTIDKVRNVFRLERSIYSCIRSDYMLEIIVFSHIWNAFKNRIIILCLVDLFSFSIPILVFGTKDLK